MVKIKLKIANEKQAITDKYEIDKNGFTTLKTNPIKTHFRNFGCVFSNKKTLVITPIKSKVVGRFMDRNILPPKPIILSQRMNFIVQHCSNNASSYHRKGNSVPSKTE